MHCVPATLPTARSMRRRGGGRRRRRALRDEGLALGEVAAICGLSPKVVRRFRRLAGDPQPSDTASPSTAAPCRSPHRSTWPANLELLRVSKGADYPVIEEGNR